MGSWEETCAVTHLPIFWDEECVMVVIDEKFLNEFNGCVYPHQITNYVKQIIKGKYNDYGGIEDFEINDDDSLICIFFKINAWEFALEGEDYNKTFLQIFGSFYQNKLNQEMKEFCRVLLKLYDLRINPFSSLIFKGCQHFNTDIYTEWNKLFNNELDKIYNREIDNV